MNIKKAIVLFLLVFVALISNNVLLAEELPSPDMMKCPYELTDTTILLHSEKQKKLYQFYFCQIKELENQLNNEKDGNTQDLINAQIDINNKHLKHILEEIKYYQ